MTRETPITNHSDSCELAQLEAVLYAAGELDESAASAFEKHLASCDVCQSAVADQHATTRLVATVPLAGASLATLDRISVAAREHITLKAKTPTAQTWLSQLRDWLVTVRPLPAFGLALAVVVLVFGIGQLALYTANDNVNTNVTNSLTWDGQTAEHSELMNDYQDTLPDYLLSDGTEYAFAYDLIALADELDVLAYRLQEF